MKLSWKIFFITTPIFSLFLTVFGCWMVDQSFQSSLKQQEERCLMENQMFQNSYELTWNALSEAQKEQTTVQMVVKSFSQKHENRSGNVRIYGEDGKVLYQDNVLQVENCLLERLNEDENVGSEVVSRGDEVYYVVLSRSSFGVYIETTKDITKVFANRADMFAQYRMGSMFLTVLVGSVILIALFLVMRNMKKLSRATRQFAGGNYDIRVKIKSNDEIGMLADDFNWMANTMSSQMEKMQDTVRGQEEFTAAFAHELKTPLTSIIGYADTIRQMELSREETDMCAGYIYSQGKRLQSLSYKLLELSMADRKEIELEEIFVLDLMRDLEQVSGPAMQEKQIALKVESEAGCIYGDRDLLMSLFLNLLDNARKASEPGTQIVLKGWYHPGGYMISVKDQGAGIPQEELSKITEAFYMVDKSRSRKEGGAGLGLALCRKIVQLHGAVWTFENCPEGGLKVSVHFCSGTGQHGDSDMKKDRKRKKSRKNDDI